VDFIVSSGRFVVIPKRRVQCTLSILRCGVINRMLFIPSSYCVCSSSVRHKPLRLVTRRDVTNLYNCYVIQTSAIGRTVAFRAHCSHSLPSTIFERLHAIGNYTPQRRSLTDPISGLSLVAAENIVERRDLNSSPVDSYDSNPSILPVDPIVSSAHLNAVYSVYVVHTSV